MKKLLLTLSVALSCGLLVLPAQAALIGVAGGSSSAGTAPSIIGAPGNVFDDGFTNTGMQGFNEAQGVLTTQAHAIDGGSIPVGTLVDSHMIFLNSSGNTFLSHMNVTWNFSGLILGVMSQFNGGQEIASTFELGNPNTDYPGSTFRARGLEGGDNYSFFGNTLTVGMQVSEPGDWIRVVTVANPVTTPEPGTILLLGSGLVGLGFWRMKKGQAA